MEKFTCPICNKELKNLQVLNTHINSHKQKQTYPSGIDCPICKKHSTTLRGLYRHSTEKHTQQEQIQIYQILSNDFSKHICENCSKEAIFNSVSKGFFRYCSIECRDVLNKINHKIAMENVDYSKVNFSLRNEKSKKTWIEIYGVDNPQKCKAIRQKSEKTLEDRTGFKTTFGNPNLRKKYEDEREVKTGYRNPWSNPAITQKCVETKTSNLKDDETFFTKSFNTLEAKTGYKYPQQNPQTRKTTEDNNIKKFGETNPMKVDSFKLKAKLTKKAKYKNGNFREYIYTEEFIKNKQEKQYATKRANNTFNKSGKEDEVYNTLSNSFPFIIERQKFDALRMPFNVDFYFPQFDLFVDFNGNWTHGPCQFDENNEQHVSLLKKWKDKSNETEKHSYWDNAIYTWTDLDVRKKKYGEKIHYLAIYAYDEKEIVEIIKNKIKELNYILTYSYTDEEIKKEILSIYSSVGKYESKPFNNKAVLSYQKHFYEKENQLFLDYEIKEKLLTNREKYLNKKRSDLTDKEILRGFKISGIHIGFSHFNWQWINAFIEEFDIKSIYDPCGGWGHRLLGSLKIKYIYNDLDIRTLCNVKALYKFCCSLLKIKEKNIFYNEDASKFIPKEKYDAVFTCPPYFNKEQYQYKKSASNILNYKEWLNWCNNLVKSSLVNCKKFVVIAICVEYKNDINDILLNNGLTLVREQTIGVPIKSFKNSGKYSSKEVLLIYRK